MFEKSIDMAFTEYKKKRYHIAIMHYKLAIDQSPNSHRPYHGIGDCLIAMNKTTQAIEYYQRACQLNPNYFRSFLNLGHAYYLLKQYDKAIEALVTSRQLKDDLPEVHELLSSCYYRTSRIALAEESIRAAIALWPDQINYYCTLHKLLSMQKKSDEARVLMLNLCAQAGWHEVEEKNYEFLHEPWFIKNIPVFENCLSPYKGQAGLSFMEIGSFEGMSTCWILDKVLTSPRSSITCIDPQFQPTFSPNIAKSKAENRVNKVEKMSQDVLFDYNDGQFDFIYIDGLHIASQVLLDALMSWPLLKTEGIMIFDDYLKEDQTKLGQTVKLGVDIFLKMFRRSMAVLYSGRQLAIKKTSNEVPESLTNVFGQVLACVDPSKVQNHAMDHFISSDGPDYRTVVNEFKENLLLNFDKQWNQSAIDALIEQIP